MAGGLHSGDDEIVESHEINVTPFIDVMLVLLIIFMVAAPLSTVDVAVDLPVSTAKAQPRPDRPVFLTIKADKTLALGNAPVAPGGLAAALDAATNADRAQRLFLRADKSVSYGELTAMMNLLRAAGYLKVALVGLEGAEGAGEPPPVPVPSPGTVRAERAGQLVARARVMTDMPRLLESRRSRLGRWAGAAAVVCALHVGGVALALMYWHEAEADDEAAGAMTVELAPLPAVVRVDSPVLPYGPDQQETRLTPQTSKQVVEKVEKDIPRVEPSPAPEPEVALPAPQPEEKETSRRRKPGTPCSIRSARNRTGMRSPPLPRASTRSRRPDRRLRRGSRRASRASRRDGRRPCPGRSSATAARAIRRSWNGAV